MPLTKAQKQERAEAIERLRQWVKPGDTIHCILRHVSKSGMSRTIQLVKFSPSERNPGEVSEAWIGYNAALVLGYPYDRRKEGIKIGGCGMDMGFALVYELGQVLFHNQPFICLGPSCPSNDHSNGDRDYSPHTHSDAGYSLRHRWL